MLDENDFDDEAVFDRAYVAKHGLYGFMRAAWEQIEPGVTFVPNWHLGEICRHIEAVSFGMIDTLLENIPPGTCKSVITSVLWHPWAWTMPGLRGKQFLFTSYAPTIVNRDAEKAFLLISSRWYQDRWPVKLLDRAMTDYRNDVGGRRISRFVGAQGITGEHPNFKCVDDPLKAADAIGARGITRQQIDRVNQVFWDGTMSTRGAGKKAASVITMQRLHEDDLTGHVLKKTPGAVHLRFPMRYEPEHACVTPFGGDWRNPEHLNHAELAPDAHELLWPRLYPEDRVKRLELDLHVHAPAQLQQRPTRAGGQIFKKVWFKYWDKSTLPSDFDQIVLSVDCTFKESIGSDFVAMHAWGRKADDYYLLDRVHDRMSFPTTLTSLRAFARSWPRASVKLVEDTANGPAVIATLEKEMPGLTPVKPLGSKVTRANAVSHLHRRGKVHYPDPAMPGFSWVLEHEAEMAGFPLARHDDSVDAETQALAYLESNFNTLWAAL